MICVPPRLAIPVSILDVRLRRSSAPHDPAGHELLVAAIDVGGTMMKAGIWDTAGRRRRSRPPYYFELRSRWTWRSSSSAEESQRPSRPYSLRFVPPSLRVSLARGTAHITLVTDAIQAAGLGDGTYHIGDVPVRVNRGRAVLADGSSLAGSTLTMDRAVANMMRFAGVPLTDGIQMASRTPADVLGLTRKGRLESGCDADLVVLTPGLDVEARWLVARGSTASRILHPS